jgi:hypothetical protein
VNIHLIHSIFFETQPKYSFGKISVKATFYSNKNINVLAMYFYHCENYMFLVISFQLLHSNELRGLSHVSITYWSSFHNQISPCLSLRCQDLLKILLLSIINVFGLQSGSSLAILSFNAIIHSAKLPPSMLLVLAHIIGLPLPCASKTTTINI